MLELFLETHCFLSCVYWVSKPIHQNLILRPFLTHVWFQEAKQNVERVKTKRKLPKWKLKRSHNVEIIWFTNFLPDCFKRCYESSNVAFFNKQGLFVSFVMLFRWNNIFGLLIISFDMKALHNNDTQPSESREENYMLKELKSFSIRIVNRDRKILYGNSLRKGQKWSRRRKQRELHFPNSCTRIEKLMENDWGE